MARIFLIIILSLIILFSVYQYNLKPLLANREANLGQYDKALARRTFLDHNIRFKIAQEIKNPEHGIILIRENIKNRPYYVRNYLIIGRFYVEVKDKKNADKVFEKAWQLSLNRQQTLVEWAKSDLAFGDEKSYYQKLEYAYQLNPKIPELQRIEK